MYNLKTFGPIKMPVCLKQDRKALHFLWEDDLILTMAHRVTAVNFF